MIVNGEFSVIMTANIKKFILEKLWSQNDYLTHFLFYHDIYEENEGICYDILCYPWFFFYLILNVLGLTYLQLIKKH